MIEHTKINGGVQIVMDYRNSDREIRYFPNTILDNARHVVANFLGGHEQDHVFVQSMIFGDGGLDDKEVKRAVNPNRTALFGVSRIKKPVVSQVVKFAALYTSVITWEEANGLFLSEMALQMSDESLFSLVTFPPLGKTDQMQLTFNWEVEVLANNTEAKL